MGKRQKKKRKSSSTKKRILRREDISAAQEASYIVKCAQRYDSRVVTLGGLLFFSTIQGDAWVLDSEDKLALCLAKEGEQLSYRIVDTETSFAIEWNSNYLINEQGFIIEDRFGKVTIFPEYPVAHILDAERRTSHLS